VHLVGGAAGPLGGDELYLDIEVGPGASLVLHTVAATLALPGPGGAMSVTTIQATVAEAGRLAWLAEPLVAAAGCHHTQLSTVELAPAAQLMWREELVAGRHGEQPGRLRQDTRLRLGAVTVLAQDYTLDAEALAPDRTLANVVFVADGDVTATATATAARMPVGGQVTLCTAVAPDVPTLRRRIAEVSPRGWAPVSAARRRAGP
jgi:urease accessory protein